MVLAAGRGERMRPLTDTTPKPLLKVHGKPLLQFHLEALARAGLTDVLINTAWLGQQISDYFSPELLSNLDNSLSISYSHEGADFGYALETAGGIARALPQLAEVFWVLAGDVYVPGFVFSSAAREKFLSSGMLAHLWLVPNPEHNRKGDFGLSAARPDGLTLALNLSAESTQARFTYSTIGLFRRELFLPPHLELPEGNPAGIQSALAPLLRAAMDNQRVSAELYYGAWTDVGTPARLAQLNENTPNDIQALAQPNHA